MFQTMKVFDVQDNMPENIKEAITSTYEDYINGNNSYIEYYVKPRSTEFDNEKEAKINTWLLDNGANEEEMILILYWW